MISSQDIKKLLLLAEDNFANSNFELAESILHEALQIDPNNSRAFELLAYISGRKGDLEIAYKYLCKATQEGDCSTAALYELGSIHLELGRYEKAESCFTSALEKSGDFFEALHDLGTVQAQLGKLSTSLASYMKALSIQKNVPQLYFNLGRLYDELKKPALALENYNEALRLEPNFANAWCNKGTTLCDLHKFDDALTCFENAYSLDPNIDFIVGDIAHIKMMRNEWIGLEQNKIILQDKINVGARVTAPFPLLSLIDDPSLHKKCAEIYTKSKYPLNSILGTIPKRSRQEKIRIGYFSSDFRDHAISYLTAELFELHNKNKFEIIAFSFGADEESSIRLRLKNAFTQFIDVNQLSNKEIAQLSRDMGIDIAVDLVGLTAQNRTGIFSYRAAPIQLSYLGYLGTMGTEYIDYLIADAVIVPEESQQFYREKMVYLPSYQANDSRRKISKKPSTRKDFGLPENSFIFSCFNNNYKILPETFDCWMRILKSIPESVLFLYAGSSSAKNNLIKSAEAKGVPKERLIFGERLPPDEYLARFQFCDLFLDTSPYNAGTTASDALWAELPVLTLLGKSFASRIAASLLKAIDLPELITTTQEEYERAAIELASNPQKLNAIRKRLTENRLTTALFNSQLFTQHLESAYEKMMERYWSDLPPIHIHV